MLHRLSLFLILFVIFDSQYLAATENRYKDIEGNITFFYPGISEVVEYMIHAVDKYNKTSPHSRNKPINIEEFKKSIIESEQRIVEQIKSSNSKNTVIPYSSIDEYVRENLVNELDNLINRVSYIFHHYLQLINPTFSSQLLHNEHVKSIKYKVSNLDETGLKSVLERIYFRLLSKFSDKEETLLDMMTNPLINKTTCKKRKSPQYLINEKYHDIIESEIKGIVLIKYVYENLYNESTSVDRLIIQSLKRMFDLIPNVKSHMALASRTFSKCHSVNPNINLGPIFQSYLTRTRTCYEYNEKFDVCHEDLCQKQRRCGGVLQNCRSAGSSIEINLQPANSSSRYEYIKFEDDTVWGIQKNSNTAFFIKNDYEWLRSVNPWYQDICLCTCDENYNDHLDRYFNLRDVTSDILLNKVVTGLKFVKNQRLIHIQIQQGQLLKNGNINVTSLEWKPIESYNVFNKNTQSGKDYYKVTWKNRTVNLDNIDAPEFTVLTGLRFEQEKNYLKLAIRYTPFNFSTGELRQNESKWMSKIYDGYERKEIPYDSTEAYTKVKEVINEEGRSIKFTVSSLKHNIGSTVVPPLDGQEITSDHPVPLSSVNLVYIGDFKQPGAISAQLTMYNFSSHFSNNLDEELKISVRQLLEKNILKPAE